MFYMTQCDSMFLKLTSATLTLCKASTYIDHTWYIDHTSVMLAQVGSENNFVSFRAYNLQWESCWLKATTRTQKQQKPSLCSLPEIQWKQAPLRPIHLTSFNTDNGGKLSVSLFHGFNNVHLHSKS